MIYEGTITKKDAIRMVGDCMVKRYNIIGTRNWVHAAYTPMNSWDDYDTLTSIGESWYGRIGTQRLSSTLPSEEERTQQIRTKYEEQFRRAYALIREAFPEVDSFQINPGSYGQIITYE